MPTACPSARALVVPGAAGTAAAGTWTVGRVGTDGMDGAGIGTGAGAGTGSAGKGAGGAGTLGAGTLGGASDGGVAVAVTAPPPRAATTSRAPQPLFNA